MKTIALLVLIQSLVTSSATNTVSFTTASGMSFTNARLVRVEPDGITVIDGTHGGKFQFTDLSEELRTRFRYEPTAAALYRAEKDFQSRAQATQLQRNADAVRLHRERTNRLEGSKMLIEGRVVRKFDGALVVNSGVDAMARMRERERFERWARPANAYAGEAEMTFHKRGLQIYVGDCVLMDYGRARVVADSEVIEVVVYPNGRYEAGGITYRAFTCRPELVTEIADEATMKELRRARRTDDVPLYIGGGSGSCNGSMDCKVCTNCARCEYCRKGGHCGKCRK